MENYGNTLEKQGVNMMSVGFQICRFFDACVLYFTLQLIRCVIFSIAMIGIIMLLRKTVFRKFIFVKGILWSLFLIVPFLGRLDKDDGNTVGGVDAECNIALARDDAVDIFKRCVIYGHGVNYGNVGRMGLTRDDEIFNRQIEFGGEPTPTFGYVGWFVGGVVTDIEA